MPSDVYVAFDKTSREYVFLKRTSQGFQEVKRVKYPVPKALEGPPEFESEPGILAAGAQELGFDPQNLANFISKATAVAEMAGGIGGAFVNPAAGFAGAAIPATLGNMALRSLGQGETSLTESIIGRDLGPLGSIFKGLESGATQELFARVPGIAIRGTKKAISEGSKIFGKYTGIDPDIAMLTNSEVARFVRDLFKPIKARRNMKEAAAAANKYIRNKVAMYIGEKEGTELIDDHTIAGVVKGNVRRVWDELTESIDTVAEHLKREADAMKLGVDMGPTLTMAHDILESYKDLYSRMNPKTTIEVVEQRRNPILSKMMEFLKYAEKRKVELVDPKTKKIKTVWEYVKDDNGNLVMKKKIPFKEAWEMRKALSEYAYGKIKDPKIGEHLELRDLVKRLDDDIKNALENSKSPTLLSLYDKVKRMTRYKYEGLVKARPIYNLVKNDFDSLAQTVKLLDDPQKVIKILNTPGISPSNKKGLINSLRAAEINLLLNKATKSDLTSLDPAKLLKGWNDTKRITLHRLLWTPKEEQEISELIEVLARVHGPVSKTGAGALTIRTASSTFHLTGRALAALLGGGAGAGALLAGTLPSAGFLSAVIGTYAFSTAVLASKTTAKYAMRLMEVSPDSPIAGTLARALFQSVKNLPVVLQKEDGTYVEGVIDHGRIKLKETGHVNEIEEGSED